MIVRSTGLGKQEMKAGIHNLEVIKTDSLIMRVNTSEPVLWQIRIVMGPSDVRDLIRKMLKPTTLFGMVKLAFKRTAPSPEGDW